MNGLGGGGGGGGVFGGGGVYGGGGIGYGGGAGGMYGGGGYGGGAYGGGAYGGGAYGGGAYGGGAYGGGAYGGAGGLGYGSPYNGGYPGAGGAAGGAVNPAAAAAGGDLTGQYLGNAAQAALRGPRVIANPMNNTLLIQATAQEYESIQELIRELDIPPRQVLIEAKIYSIDLTYSFSSDITAALQSLNATGSVASTAGSLMSGLSASGGVSLSAAMLVGKSRQLLGTVTLMESESRAKVLSAPAVIATDSIPASISVGTTVPTLSSSTASGITGATTQGISNTSTGIGLNIVARVTPSGIVTMIINQNISDPEATTNSSSGSSIGSPSFATKSISTQVTVQDGDTIAIGGQIQESTTTTLAGIPLLDRIPFLGALFGARSYGKERTELIMFLTPHVIFDSNQMIDATDELRDKIKLLRKDVKE